MIRAFLPCRRGSERIRDKNVTDFAGIKGGLLKIKIDQLLKCEVIDEIVVSSNDSRVLEFAQKQSTSKIVLDERPDSLGSSETSTDQLIEYVPKIINEGHVIWTHVTAPFVDEYDYRNMIELYKKELLNGYDSLMSVKKIQGFLWSEDGPFNYDPQKEKWPRTQTLNPLFEIDSGVFIASIDIYKNQKNRIGKKPFMYTQDHIKSTDIDWPEDFIFAEQLWRSLK